MIIHGIDAEPIHGHLLQNLRASGIAYLHHSDLGGWVGSEDKEPPGDGFTETIELRLIRHSSGTPDASGNV